MSAALEHRYRRVLRLLPVGYRQAWEEDMVSAFMQSTDGAATNRPSLIMGALALAPGGMVTVGPAPPQWPFEHWNLSIATHVGLHIGMIMVLVRAARGAMNAHVLFVLAALGGGLAGVRLLGHLITDIHGNGSDYLTWAMGIWPAAQILLAALAVTCAVVGALALRRLPRSSSNLPPERS